MLPVLVLQHLDDGGPGYLGEFLARRGIALEIRRPDRGEPVPADGALNAYSGICLCGGTQSVTQPDLWMRDEIALIRAARARNLPVIGHCLGGQLISHAFGGRVARHTVPEFGWQRLQRVEGPLADAWLAGAPEAPVCIQWHNDSFTLPDGAVALLRGEYCENQAFVLGNMLGMQFHVEVTAATVRYWATALAHLIPPRGASVQSAEEVLSLLDRNIASSMQLADALYTRWLEQVA